MFKSFFVVLKKFIYEPLAFALKPFYKNIILPLYNVLLKIFKVSNKFLDPFKQTYLVPFFNRYVTHALVILITIAIVFLNYQVKETRAESFGEESILYALVRGDDFDDLYIEETVDDSPAVASSYFDNEIVGSPATQQIIQPDNTIVSSGQRFEQIAITQGGAVAPTGISSIEATKKKRDKITNYEVKGGDTVSGIAAQFGLKTSTLLWANNMSATSYLKPGQNLDIPPIDGIVYEVSSGDTLGSIAKKYDAELEEIIEFNKLADASDISRGQILMLPNAQPYQAPVPVQKTKIAPVREIFTPRSETATAAPTGAGKLIWPTPTRRISQYYHWRHTALDIDGEFGDMIWSSGDGVVTRVQYLNWGYGYHVIVDHGGGTHTLYAHFQRIYVQPGQKVSQGDILGEMGSTGRSTGSHLHYEVRVNGSRLNPFAYVSGY